MSNNRYKILIIEDEANICNFLKTLLTTNNYQVFIAEMGARHVGDIKKLAKIVEPNFAIINGIVTFKGNS